MATIVNPVDHGTQRTEAVMGEMTRSEAEIYAGCDYRQEGLSVIVLGASGDLAKKKTYPSLFELFKLAFLPPHARVFGYARSKMTDKAFREKMHQSLNGMTGSPEELEGFLEICHYRSGQYDSEEDVLAMVKDLEKVEAESGMARVNRLFYLAIPPTVFSSVGKVIRSVAMIDETKGWNRVVVEKPFGKDLESFEALNVEMSHVFREDQTYRIDHFLGKEMVQNLLTLRFANSIYEPLWNRNYIQSITITFKENIGTQGRGGYFDEFGIIRDVMQNHLLQVLCIVAMEPPSTLFGPDGPSSLRDAKVNVLKAMATPTLREVVVGQYTADDDGKNPGYTDDDTVPEGSQVPTFATMIFHINNTRWDGVPFIMKAGKALNERKAEIRIQFHTPPGCSVLFEHPEDIVRNELVIRMQPDEAIYLVNNVKAPGLDERTVASELNLSYKDRYNDLSIPDAYTRLLIEVLRGKQSEFVREDELRASWKIFTPILKELDENNIKPILYKFGSRGPEESDELVKNVGYHYHEGMYKWAKKTQA